MEYHARKTPTGEQLELLWFARLKKKRMLGYVTSLAEKKDSKELGLCAGRNVPRG